MLKMVQKDLQIELLLVFKQTAPNLYTRFRKFIMSKGKFKRRSAGGHFTLGHKKHKKSPAYLNHFAVTAGSGYSSDVSEDQVDKGCSKKPELRQRKPDLKVEYKPLGNRIINLDQCIYIMNNIYQQHSSGNCKNLNISLHLEMKYGLGSKLQFKCNSCDFLTDKMETYKRRPDGKGAAINMLLASALQDMAIGVEKSNLLFTSMDIPPPARSHMQNLMNAASINTVELNEKDMAEKRQLVIQHNQEKGQQNPNLLDLSFDGRYNATRMVSSYKPGQAASQAYGVAIENHTSYKYIVGLAVQNKLCWTGAYLRNKGFDITCPSGHAECTATFPYMQPHSERKMSYNIVEQLSNEDLLVRTLTTDGDTAAHLGMNDFYDKMGYAWSVNRQADPHHLGSRQVRKARASNWSTTLFQGKKLTGSTRQQAISALGKDIKARCSTIIEKLRANGNGLTEELNRLPAIRTATIECYAGNCSFCPHDSIVCAGLGGVGDWWYHSKFLPTHGIHHLQMSKNDRELLSAILEIRLSESAILSVTTNTSTQKCEGFNRAVLSTMPKDINMSRNFAGSLASKTLQLNNSLQTSVEKKVKSITGMGLSRPALRYLKLSSKRAKRHKYHQTTAKFKTHRKNNRAKLEHVYHQARSTGQYQEEYMKGQLDEAQTAKQ
jgi:hypothetical protein